MKVLKSRNYIYFNLLVLSLIIPNYTPASSGTNGNRNYCFDSVLKKSYFRESLESLSFFNDQFINQISEVNLDLALNENSDKNRNLEIHNFKAHKYKT